MNDIVAIAQREDVGKIEIIYDCDAQNPRLYETNISKMVCFHKKYSMGDQDHDYDFDDYTSWQELEKAICKNEDVAVIKPLYMYDHSGITISTSPFNCSWDSGQIGFVYITKEALRKENQVKRLSKKIIASAENNIEMEVEYYDYYLRGECYGFKAYDSEENEVDSCWDMIGYEYTKEMLKEFLTEEFNPLIEELKCCN